MVRQINLLQAQHFDIFVSFQSREQPIAVQRHQAVMAVFVADRHGVKNVSGLNFLEQRFPVLPGQGNLSVVLYWIIQVVCVVWVVIVSIVKAKRNLCGTSIVVERLHPTVQRTTIADEAQRDDKFGAVRIVPSQFLNDLVLHAADDNHWQSFRCHSFTFQVKV